MIITMDEIQKEFSCFISGKVVCQTSAVCDIFKTRNISTESSHNVLVEETAKIQAIIEAALATAVKDKKLIKNSPFRLHMSCYCPLSKYPLQSGEQEELKENEN